MAKLAYGFADNLLTTVARAWWFPGQEQSESSTKKRVFFAPSMNTRMWEHPFTAEQIDRLTQRLGWICVPPTCKVLLCGEHGVGAMAELEEICSFVYANCDS
ncbi:hypothetical protein CRM22_010545 [Opisthorchis felineus]|uniref:Flavoprotein domain-containing protein n=1 Tax=Opisthorchis felineus TaxID=147828 RepID=A0A4S2L2V0_OPIFE|nr:hypothetical protein CRM22_010545 [Opisthorchis felineus]